ncbi:MAG: hypothetical protein AAFQ21_03730 [Pseudomonadota bacterium]
MAMGNLHNELEQRRQAQRSGQSDDAPYYSNIARSLSALFVLQWMIANRSDTPPEPDQMDWLMQQAQQAVDGLDALDNRNTEIKLMLALNEDFEALQAEWSATDGDAAAERRLSNRVWRTVETRSGIDLRSLDLRN